MTSGRRIPHNAKRLSSGGNSVASVAKNSSVLLGTHVWVRTDLVEAILENGGTLPDGWKPRKRVRSSSTYFSQQIEQNNDSDSSSWGWCRARVSSAKTPTPSPDRQLTNDQKNNPKTALSPPSNEGNPFASIKLRKTNQSTPSRPPNAKQESWRGSPDRVKKKVAITVTVDDEELAAPHLQNVTVSFTYETSDLSKVCMANAWWQPDQALDDGMNDSFDKDEPPDDLTRLEQLHEPAVVFCLQRRYEYDHIYTYTGKVLLALNPFRAIENIYSEETMKQYWNGGMSFRSPDPDTSGTDISCDSRRPPPHIYAIAEDAYRSMIRSLEAPPPTAAKRGKPPAPPVGGEDQSILVSGESGAGKTVTTKIILRYLATLSSQRHKLVDDTPQQKLVSIESQVLESNPILESFGNARTVRNDNSSRFGKYMEMQFDRHGCLVSASVETYLLEKVRLISQSAGERNYHVFYEILAGLPKKDRHPFYISNKTAEDFRMTAVSGTFDRRDGVEDRVTYKELKNALETVGFTKGEQSDLFRVACALLHASNLTFLERSADGSVLDEKNPSLQAALSLLGVSFEALNDALTKCAISVKEETVYKNLPADRAEKAVEALIKTTYGALFTYIVRKINSFVTIRPPEARKTSLEKPRDFLGISKGNKSSMNNTSQGTASIGVLDIFGFESFDKNSFEQLCINYCNEALQQQFNRFVFKLEQEEYQKEGIEWSFIEFPDNQDVLDLIEKKRDGIISILDEQCMLPRCTDATFASVVYKKCAEHGRFVVSKAQRARLAFSIEHYAGPVEYDTQNFLEKNKDELPKETTELLISSRDEFLSRLGQELTEPTSTSTQNQPKNRNNRQINRASSSLLRESVGGQFCAQLRVLRIRIESTAPHYVRCLKPNDDLVPYNFNHLVIADQLRCAGVLEAIRVSRVGFPHRYYHDHFIHRYALLGRSTLLKQFGWKSSKLMKGKDVCEALVNLLAPRVKEVSEEGNENDQTNGQGSKRNNVFLGIQLGKTKVFIRRRAFEALEYIRGRKLEDSATIIQSIIRKYLARRTYKELLIAIVRIQHFLRGFVEYKKRRKEMKEHAARVIQRTMRCLKARRTLTAARWIAWWCQSAYRGAIARQYCAYLFLDRNASIIQRSWRRYCLGFAFRKLRRSMISLQNRYRRNLAFRELCRLRREARDLSAVAAERDRFKEESKRLKEELERAKQAPPPAPETMKSPNRRERESEMRKLRSEVQRLQFELEKAHRMQSSSKRKDPNTKRLIEELANREEELDFLKKEVVALRSRDEVSSLRSLRSLTIETSCVSEFSSRRPRASPARSDVSLLDNDCEDLTEDTTSSTDPLDPPTGFNDLEHLHNAIRQGDYNMLDHVLHQTSEACVLINQGDQYGRTAIHLASLSLNVEIAELLVSKGSVVNAQDDDGETPLHLAENSAMTELLLTKGKANPNIPNVDGICALHLAVQRRDVDSVRALIRKKANVNNADNVRWFTPLHLLGLPARAGVDERYTEGSRLQIAHLLTATYGQNVADLNYQDSDGNTPMHYAVQLESQDACDLVSLFLERGANPNIRNTRDQIPLHLLCHNSELRKRENYQEIIHVMLMHGADPNMQSLTGCTPLHLSLYHRDIDTAVQLVHGGAELHLIWKKPKRWPSFWRDMGSSRIVALDMVEDNNDLYRILASITTPHKSAPRRTWCMHCKKNLSDDARAIHCRHCSRLTCSTCTSSLLPAEYFPKNFEVTEPSWACSLCERILSSQKEVMSNITHPISSYGDEDDDIERFSC